MDASVGDQSFHRLLRNLAPIRIEPGQDDRARRVVDDEIDAGRELEGPDVPAFAADDAPFQIVARQIDDRHRRLDRVLGSAALNPFGQLLLRWCACRSASLRPSAAFSLASSRPPFFPVSASRSASLPMLGARASARPSVSAAIRLRLGSHQPNTAAPRVIVMPAFMRYSTYCSTR